MKRKQFDVCNYIRKIDIDWGSGPMESTGSKLMMIAPFVVLHHLLPYFHYNIENCVLIRKALELDASLDLDTEEIDVEIYDRCKYSMEIELSNMKDVITLNGIHNFDQSRFILE